METILLDIYLADSYANNMDYASKFRDYLSLVRYKQAESLVFNKYKLENKRFESSMEYYLYHDENLNKMYEDLSQKIEHRKKKVMDDSVAYRKKDSIEHPEKRIRAKHIQDSIAESIKKAAMAIRRRDSLKRIHAIKPPHHPRHFRKEETFLNLPDFTTYHAISG